MYIQNAADLKAAINELEEKHNIQEKMLIDQINITCESLKPVNIIKGTLTEVAKSPELKTNLLKVILGLGAGILTKKLLLGNPTNFFMKTAGVLLELGIAKLVAKTPVK